MGIVKKENRDKRASSGRRERKEPPSEGVASPFGAALPGLEDLVTGDPFPPGASFLRSLPRRPRGGSDGPMPDVGWLAEVSGAGWRRRKLLLQSRQVERAYEKLESLLGRPAQDLEVAQALGMRVSDLQSLLEQMGDLQIGCFRPVRDRFCGAGGEQLEYADSEDEEWSSPRPRTQFRRLLARFLEELPDQERLVVTLRYYERLSAAEIAQVMKLHPSLVRQVHARAILRMRGKLRRVLA